jgi:hypothetical protein
MPTPARPVQAAAASAAAAAAGAANLAASYAAVQSTLRRQFYGDLVDLRGALLSTMSLAPHRAASLHPKMSLIDAALAMLEVRLAGVALRRELRSVCRALGRCLVA